MIAPMVDHGERILTEVFELFEVGPSCPEAEIISVK